MRVRVYHAARTTWTGAEHRRCSEGEIVEGNSQHPTLIRFRPDGASEPRFAMLELTEALDEEAAAWLAHRRLFWGVVL